MINNVIDNVNKTNDDNHLVKINGEQDLEEITEKSFKDKLKLNEMVNGSQVEGLNGPSQGLNGTSQSINGPCLNGSDEIGSTGAIKKHSDIESSLEARTTINYVQYENELQMPLIMNIIQKKLSEPYSIYTYRYFIHNWPQLCFLAMCESKCVGAIVCKLDVHRKATYRTYRGYIAMLAVDENYRRRSIGSTLVKKAIMEMINGGADEVVLETEVTNQPALKLYEALGFVRDKRLFRYYLNGVDALRLKLWLR